MLCPTTHVIFDCAGTLVDVFGPLITIGHEFGQKYGVKVKPQYFGNIADFYSFEDGIKYFIGNLNIPEGEQLIANLKEIKNKYFQKLVENGFQLIPGIDRLIKHLYEHNIPMAIASNMKESEVNSIIDRTVGFERKYFSHFVCGADDPEVKNNKPSPDVYLVCAKRFNPPPKSMDNCVIFEDCMTGITGAVETGMKTVLLKNPYSGSTDALKHKITEIVESWQHFKPESVGLPPYVIQQEQ